MTDSNTKVVNYKVSKVLPVQSVRLVGLKQVKKYLRVDIAMTLPDCSCCVTYAYFLEATNRLTSESRRITGIADLTSLEDLIVTCVAQCITELEDHI